MLGFSPFASAPFASTGSGAIVRNKRILLVKLLLTLMLTLNGLMVVTS